MNGNRRTTFFFGILLAAAGLVWAVASARWMPAKASYSEFVAQVESGAVRSAVVAASQNGTAAVTYNLRDGTARRTLLPADYHDLLEAMQQRMVNIEIREAAQAWRVVGNSAPFLILLGFWFFMLRKLPKHRV